MAALLQFPYPQDARTAGPRLTIRKDGIAAAVASFSLRTPAPLDPSSDLDDVLGAGWERHFLLEAMPIAVFEHLATDASTPSATLWRCVRSLVDHLVAPQADMLLLKAFPLEWDGRPEGFSTRAGTLEFSKRQSAMVLHYHGMLGALPVLPPSCGGVWMWLPLRGGVPEPIFRCRDVRAFSRALIAHATDPHGLGPARPTSP